MSNQAPNPTLQKAWDIGQTNPTWWIEHVLQVKMHNVSRQIINSVVNHDMVRIQSGHGISKSYTLACIAIWWVIVKRGLVIYTGPKFDVVRLITMSYIRKILNHAAIPTIKSAEPNADRWVVDANDFVGIYIVNSSREQATNVQGFHSDRMLLIADEAAGISDELFDAFESTQVSRGVEGAEAKVIMSGNPTEQDGCNKFKLASPSPEGQAPTPHNAAWHHLSFSSFDSPNVTGECHIPGLVGRAWIEQQRAEWGEHSMFFYVRVLGKYWESGKVDRLVSDSTLTEAYARSYKAPEYKSIAQGVDVARFGDDQTVSYIIENNKVVDVAMIAMADTVEVARWTAERHKQFGCHTTAMDITGLGAGAYDVVRNSHPEVHIVGVNFAEKSFKPNVYRNMRAQMGFEFRDALRDGTFFPGSSHPRLYEDCKFITYKVMAGGELQLTDKGEIKKELKRSPDHFDAAMLAWYAGSKTRFLSPEEVANAQLQKAFATALESQSAPVGRF